MAGFRKAKAEQAALKMAMFGPAGSGKTFTSLLLAEGLAQATGKRIAYWDTEHGTDFYAKSVPNRQVHPDAFDFDAIYTRSITDGSKDLFALSPEDHGVVVIDSMTHIWEATINSYTGRKNSNGQIPMHAWSGIKAPYKRLMQWMLNSKMHVILLGRQANEWGTDDETGETVASGVKMKAEGETAYEPHILVRMEGVKQLREDGKSVKKNAEPVPTMFVIKDRTGVLQGKVIENPTYQLVVAPIVGLLGDTQAQIMDGEDAAAMDGETLRKQKHDKAARSAELRRTYKARFELCKTKDEANVIAKELTPTFKKEFLPDDLDVVRAAWDAVGTAAQPQQQAAGRPVTVDAPPPDAE